MKSNTNPTGNRSKTNPKRQQGKQALFTVRQDFRAIRLDYFAHGDGITLQHLPERFDTLFDLIQFWPSIMNWLRAEAHRSLSISVYVTGDVPAIYCEIDHASEEIHSTAASLKWIIAAKKG